MKDTKKTIAILGSIAILTAAKTASVFFPISSQIAQDQINPDFTYEEQIGDASTAESSNNDLLNVTNDKTYTISYNNDGTKTWYFEDGFWVKFDSGYNVISHGLASKQAASTITSPTGIFGLDIEKDLEGNFKEWPEKPTIVSLENGDKVCIFPEGITITLDNTDELDGSDPKFTREGTVDPAKLPEGTENLFGITKNKTHTTSYNNDGTKTWYFEDGFWVKFDSEYNVISHGLVSQKAASTITSPTGIFGLDIEKEFEGQIKEWPGKPEIIKLGDGGVVIDFPEGVEIVFSHGTESVNGEPEFIYVGGVDPTKLPGDQSLSQEDTESTMSL